MKKGVSKVVVSLALLLSSLVYLLYPYEASAVFGIGPFGGMILVVIPCDFGILEILSPPVPGSYMYLPGITQTYLYIPPLHPKQWVLGMAGPPFACVIGPVVVGAGRTMLFEGASL